MRIVWLLEGLHAGRTLCVHRVDLLGNVRNNDDLTKKRSVEQDVGRGNQIRNDQSYRRMSLGLSVADENAIWTKKDRKKQSMRPNNVGGKERGETCGADCNMLSIYWRHNDVQQWCDTCARLTRRNDCCMCG